MEERNRMEQLLSVIIVSWNTKDLLRGCLFSLQRIPEAARAQVLVVDNASSDGTVEMVRADFPLVELVASPQNLGFAAANNLVLPRARGRYLLFLNPDTEVTEGAIREMIHYLENHPEAGIVGTTLLNPDGTVQLSCRRFYSFWHSLKYNRLTDAFLGRRELLAVNRGSQPTEVDWMMGACLATKRSVLETVGAFDPRFFVYGEEVDLQYRVSQAGWRVVYVPSTGVIHHGSQSARQAGVAASLHCYRGRWLFIRKHYSTLSGVAYLAKAVGALALWMVFWGTLAVIRKSPEAGSQVRAHWRLLAWHLGGRDIPPVPQRVDLPAQDSWSGRTTLGWN